MHICIEEIQRTGKIPEGLSLLQDTSTFKILDRKKTTIKSPLLEDKGINSMPAMRCIGIFQKCDEKNANGRIYPYDVLKEAVEGMQERISSRGALGEWDHPIDAKIHLDRASHLVTRLWMEGKTLMGQLEVLNDDRCPCGSMLACLLDRGIQVGISSRGVGDMELVMNEGEEVYKVSPGYSFIAFDCVSEPSVSGTQLKRLEEARQRVLDSKQKEINAKRGINLNESRERILGKEIRKYFIG